MTKRNNFDPTVAVRAHRFRAKIAGYRIVRGHFMDKGNDRADRYYLIPLDNPDAERDGSGYRTIKMAADVAEERNRSRQ